MTREKLAFYRNDIIRDYANGISAARIARSFGVTTTTVTRILKGAGAMQSLGRGDQMRRADEQTIICEFNRGMKPHEIITKYGVSKSALYAILNRAGVDLRGHVEERKTIAQLTHLAKIREERGICNKSESLFQSFLSEGGFNSKAQVALGTGVIDFVIPTHSVAVEISLRGTFNKYVSEGWFIDRIKNCANRGWHCYIFGGQESSDINADTVKDIFAWLEFLNRSPASRRQYRVVWCGTNLLAAGCSDDNHITIPRPSEYASKVANRKGES